MTEPEPSIRELNKAGPGEIRTYSARGPTEPEEFDDFFRSNYSALVRWIRFSAADQAIAEDAAQEAMMITYRKWQDIEQPRKYAFTVATRLASKMIRHELVLRGAAEDLDRDLALVQVSTIGRPEAADLQYDVVQGIRSLPRRQQEIVALRWVFDWSLAEIAAFLKISPSAVRSHVHDARQRLRRILEDDLQPARGLDVTAAWIFSTPERSEG